MLSGTLANVAVKVFGDDLRELRVVARQVQAEISSVPGVVDLSLEQQTDIPTLRIHPDPALAARAAGCLDGGGPGRGKIGCGSVASGGQVGDFSTGIVTAKATRRPRLGRAVREVEPGRASRGSTKCRFDVRSKKDPRGGVNIRRLS